MDDDTYELTRRRLVDDVRETVRKQLFTTYALVGGAVIAAFAYANWDFMDDLKTDARDAVGTITAEVRKAADESKREVKEEMNKELNTIKQAVYHQTGRIDYEAERAGKLLAEVSDQLGKLDVEAATLGKLNETVDVLARARRETQQQLAEFSARVEKLTVLEDELKRLAEALKSAQPQSAAVVREVVANVDRAQETAQALVDRPTVYLQFAGGARSKAEELSRRLGEQGYVMPGEERLAAAGGKREVRYFHEEDGAEAERLAQATQGALAQMHYKETPPVRVVDMTGYKSKPKPGILELWVEL